MSTSIQEHNLNQSNNYADQSRGSQEVPLSCRRSAGDEPYRRGCDLLRDLTLRECVVSLIKLFHLL